MQRAGVVQRDVLQPDQLHVGGTRHMARDHRIGRQLPARKDVALDEVGVAQGRRIALVRDGDGLDQRQTLGLEQMRYPREVVLVVLRAHRLDHLDGHQLVVLALQLPIVLLQHRDAITQPFPGDPLPGMAGLGGRQRGGGDAAAKVAGRMQGKTAPAGANLQQVVRGLQLQALADVLELVGGGFFQRARLRREDGRGIGHGGVEEELEEVVAQVVMGRDVATGTMEGVAVQQVEHPRGQAPGQTSGAVHVAQQVHVQHEQADGLQQVRAFPQAFHERLAGTQ